MNRERWLSFKTLGWLELGLAMVLLAYACFSFLAHSSEQALFPKSMSGLAPLLITFTGLTLAIASAPLISVRRWPLLLHVPLILWLVIMWFALL